MVRDSWRNKQNYEQTGVSETWVTHGGSTPCCQSSLTRSGAVLPIDARCGQDSGSPEACLLCLTFLGGKLARKLTGTQLRAPELQSEKFTLRNWSFYQAQRRNVLKRSLIPKSLFLISLGLCPGQGEVGAIYHNHHHHHYHPESNKNNLRSDALAPSTLVADMKMLDKLARSYLE